VVAQLKGRAGRLVVQVELAGRIVAEPVAEPVAVVVFVVFESFYEYFRQKLSLLLLPMP
jgi:hypothetical protein